MKRTELERKLRRGGWIIISGGKHNMAKHPDSTKKIPIPRGSLVNEQTAKKILKEAWLL